MAKDSHDHPDGDPVAWARAETVSFTKRRFKRYGLLTLGNVAAIALILKGMPAHAFASAAGIPLAVSFACFFTPTLYYGSILIREWLDERQNP